MSEKVAVAKLSATTEERGGVLAKLVAFSLALGVGPISSYFISKDYLWDGNSTYAAITAIVVANTVLVAYILLSLRDEAKEAAERKQNPESRKER